MAALLGVGVFAGVNAGRDAKVEKAEAATYNFKFHVTNATGWNQLAVHLWDVNDSSNKTTTWPGKAGVFEYTNEHSQGVYHFEFSLDFIPNKVIFNNNIKEGASQTSAIDFDYNSLTEHTAYVVNSSGISGNWTFEDLTREYYIYLNKTEVISSTNLHVFADNNNDSSYPIAWPGYEMTVVENTGGKVYKTPAIPCKYNRLKFTSNDYSDSHQQQANDVCGYNGQAWNSYGYSWESLLDVKVQSWIDTYMHMDSNVPGQCNTYFGPAKENLTQEVYAELSTNDMFAAAYKRYCDWAAALGRNPNPEVVDGAAVVVPFEVETSSYSSIAIIATVSALAVGGFFFFKKKRLTK